MSELVPRPWLIVGVVLLVAGIVIARGRRREGRRRRVRASAAPGAILLVGLAFYAVGRSEDRDRERKRAGVASGPRRAEQQRGPDPVGLRRAARQLRRAAWVRARAGRRACCAVRFMTASLRAPTRSADGVGAELSRASPDGTRPAIMRALFASFAAVIALAAPAPDAPLPTTPQGLARRADEPPSRASTPRSRRGAPRAIRRRGGRARRRSSARRSTSSASTATSRRRPRTAGGPCAACRRPSARQRAASRRARSRASSRSPPRRRSRSSRTCAIGRAAARRPADAATTAPRSGASASGWYVLAAVNLVETGFNKLRNDSVAGAQGPMQFIPVDVARLRDGRRTSATRATRSWAPRTTCRPAARPATPPRAVRLQPERPLRQRRPQPRPPDAARPERVLRLLRVVASSSARRTASGGSPDPSRG